mmetsp:Transcript_14236/g.41865  ORF Transcript_14236/g.41865 Transcript_14236/m.41865 type:complete len:303 (-) Transcript_14236:530-1438(-)
MPSTSLGLRCGRSRCFRSRRRLGLGCRSLVRLVRGLHLVELLHHGLCRLGLLLRLRERLLERALLRLRGVEGGLELAHVALQPLERTRLGRLRLGRLELGLGGGELLLRRLCLGLGGLELVLQAVGRAHLLLQRRALREGVRLLLEQRLDLPLRLGCLSNQLLAALGGLVLLRGELLEGLLRLGHFCEELVRRLGGGGLLRGEAVDFLLKAELGVLRTLERVLERGLCLDELLERLLGFRKLRRLRLEVRILLEELVHLGGGRRTLRERRLQVLLELSLSSGEFRQACFVSGGLALDRREGL